MSGVFLVVTGIKMRVIADHTPDIVNNAILKFFAQKHDSRLLVSLWKTPGQPEPMAIDLK